MKISNAGFLALMLFADFACANSFLSANDLYKHLKGYDRGMKDEESVGAVGYVMAIVDDRSGKEICMPIGSTLSQATRSVLNHLEAHPEQWNYVASSVAKIPLIAMWPCQ